MTSIRGFQGHTPRLGDRVYIDPAATVIGQVSLGDDVSIWPGSVLRGDVNSITIGARSNIQDGCVLHVTHDGCYTPGGVALAIGENVTVGHRVVLHACQVADLCLIGMGAVIMDEVTIGTGCIIGAGALLPPGKVLEPNGLYVGSPARRMKDLEDEDRQRLRYSADHYVKLKDVYLGNL